MNTYRYVDNNPLRYVDPFGKIKWEGSVVTYIYTPIDISGRPSHRPGVGLGGFFSLYTLTSDCVRGQRWKVKVRAHPSTETGGGVLALSLPAGMHGTDFVEFEDGNVGTIDPYVFNGSYASLSGSLVTGGGVMGSETALGNAYGEWSWVPAAGVDWYGAVMTGKSTVISAEPQLCEPCGNK